MNDKEPEVWSLLQSFRRIDYCIGVTIHSKHQTITAGILDFDINDIIKVEAGKLKKWLDEGNHPDNKTETGENSPLCNAVFQNRCDIAEMLIKAGANINFLGLLRRTPLMNACRTGNFEMAKRLIASGADIQLKDADGRSALAIAAFNNHALLVEYLLIQGADPNTSWDQEHGTSILMMTAENGFIQIITSLLRYGANPVAIDKMGLTPRLYAYLAGKNDSVTSLPGESDEWEVWKKNHQALPEKCIICSGMPESESVDLFYWVANHDIRPKFFRLMDLISDGVWHEAGYLQMEKEDIYRCPCCGSLFRKSLFKDEETYCNSFRITCTRILENQRS